MTSKNVGYDQLVFLCHTDRVVVLSTEANDTSGENVEDTSTKPLPKRTRLLISASLMQLSSNFIAGAKKRRGRIEVEYETESTQKQQRQQLASASF